MYYHIVPETLRTHRDRLRLTQAELADVAGVERRTILQIEKHGRKVRDFTAKYIADALKIDIDELLRPMPEERFYLDVDVFEHLRNSLKDGDFYHAQKLIEYITYSFAEALELAQIDLIACWQTEVLAGPKPPLPHVSAGPVEVSHGLVEDEQLHQLLSTWHAMFQSHPVNPDKVLREPRHVAFQAAVKKLPVVERGRVNTFWFKALLRRISGGVVREYRLQRVPSSEAELWCVVEEAAA